MKLQTARKFLNFINKRIEVAEFESWIYNNSNLEKELGSEFYTDIVLINYKDKSARVEFEKIADSKIDYSSLHTRLLTELIDKVLQKEIDLLDGLSKLYYEWLECGYTFLSEIITLGNFGEQGKSIVHIMDKTMTNEEKWNVMDKESPHFTMELTDIRTRINNGRIILTGNSEMNKFLGRQFEYKLI